MKLQYLTISPRQTKKTGEALAKEILRSSPEDKAFLLGLEGDLGGGKTTFLQGFARGLGVKEKIASPTFVIMKKFRIPLSALDNFYHFDCYRIKKLKEILDLDFKKIISRPQNVVVVEWSDRIRKILPEKSLILKFQFIDKNKRKITLNEGKFNFK